MDFDASNLINPDDLVINEPIIDFSDVIDVPANPKGPMTRMNDVMGDVLASVSVANFSSGTRVGSSPFYKSSLTRGVAVGDFKVKQTPSANDLNFGLATRNSVNNTYPAYTRTYSNRSTSVYYTTLKDDIQYFPFIKSTYGSTEATLKVYDMLS